MISRHFLFLSLALAIAAVVAPLAGAPPAIKITPPSAEVKAQPSPDASSSAASNARAMEGFDLDSKLDQEIGETGGSPADILRVLERHMKLHPECPKKAEITRLLARISVEQRDKARVFQYGPTAIEGGSDDPRLLDQVSRALLERGDSESLNKALKYGLSLVTRMHGERNSQLSSKGYEPGQGRRLEETEFALQGALIQVARANEKLGQNEDALKAVDEAWQVYPSLEGALERSHVLERLGRHSEALDAAADAFTVDDQRSTSKDRQRARERLSELASKASVVDPSVRVLPAWDRTRGLLEARNKRMREYDPNLLATSPLEFTMSKLEGGLLPMSSMKGKVVVLDFWATWCGPCRVQHPLYEVVKSRFKNNSDVVFLAVSTDEDRSLVKPYLERQKWSKEVLYDDGLGSFFRVNSIPTTIVLDRSGEVNSRMPGFVPDRFVEMLSERINSALTQN